MSHNLSCKFTLKRERGQGIFGLILILGFSLRKDSVIIKSSEMILKIEEKGEWNVKVYLDNCCFHASCDFFLTTDDRLLKYSTDEIELINPIDFIKRLEDS